MKVILSGMMATVLVRQAVSRRRRLTLRASPPDLKQGRQGMEVRQPVAADQVQAVVAEGTRRRDTPPEQEIPQEGKRRKKSKDHLDHKGRHE